jgi:hypothetical protein
MQSVIVKAASQLGARNKNKTIIITDLGVHYHHSQVSPHKI